MELTSREDIEAPLEQVFAALSDFDHVERQVLRRGIDVQRTRDVTPTAEGLAWRAEFTFRGKPRRADITLTQFQPAERLVFETVSGGLTTEMAMDVVALSRARTRISTVAVLMPRTLSARLLVQSLKLAKGGIDKRFQTRMHQLARELETRLQAQA
jgi:uncharacterized protein YndB with AHSA1/START domain